MAGVAHTLQSFILTQQSRLDDILCSSDKDNVSVELWKVV